MGGGAETLRDDLNSAMPSVLEAIHRDTRELGFRMASEPKTGALLRMLAASKPGGRLLELGTGTGIGTAWLLAGMDASSTLESVDSDERVVAVARRHLAADPRVTFHVADGASFLARLPRRAFDLVYADTWPGKFTDLDTALSLLRVGGIYFVDDLLPQSGWPEGHGAKVRALIDALEHHREFAAVKLSWASGLMILARTAGM